MGGQLSEGYACDSIMFVNSTAHHIFAGQEIQAGTQTYKGKKTACLRLRGSTWMPQYLVRFDE